MQAQFDTSAGNEVATLSRCEGYGVLSQPGSGVDLWFTGLENDTTAVGLAQLTRIAQVAGDDVIRERDRSNGRQGNVWDRFLSLVRN